MIRTKEHWFKHRQILEPYRVRPGDFRTTPAPVLNITEVFPELIGRSKITVRLNPRYGEEPPIGASKLEGKFFWPANEHWPICKQHGTPLIGVLQLRAEDFPEMLFYPGTDLFQLLWCPRWHDNWLMVWADPAFFWRQTQDIQNPRMDNPAAVEPDYEFLLV